MSAVFNKQVIQFKVSSTNKNYQNLIVTPKFTKNNKNDRYKIKILSKFFQEYSVTEIFTNKNNYKLNKYLFTKEDVKISAK